MMHLSKILAGLLLVCSPALAHADGYGPMPPPGGSITPQAANTAAILLGTVLLAPAAFATPAFFKCLFVF